MDTSNLLLFFFFFVETVVSREFTVGGSDWAVPDPPSFYNQWAERNRFQINDSLVFNYPADQDSVLRVEWDGYERCNTSVYMESFTGGRSVFTFPTAGPFFFISGAHNHCAQNEKLFIIVMADRTNTSRVYNSSPPSPAPTHIPTQTPTQAPTHIPTQTPTQAPTQAPTQPSPIGPSQPPSLEPKNGAPPALPGFTWIVSAAAALALINI